MDGCVCVTDFRDRTKTSIMKVLIFVECGRFEKHELKVSSAIKNKIAVGDY